MIVLYTNGSKMPFFAGFWCLMTISFCLDWAPPVALMELSGNNNLPVRAERAPRPKQKTRRLRVFPFSFVFNDCAFA
jgi:hypothetical protein